MPNVNEVWGGAPVQRVNSLQDLNKLVASAPVGSVEVRAEPVQKVDDVSDLTMLEQAYIYHRRHPKEDLKVVAAKFGVNASSIYTKKATHKKRTLDECIQFFRDNREQNLARQDAIAKALKVKEEMVAEGTFRRKHSPKQKKKVDVEVKVTTPKWVHNSVSTSAAPVKEDVVNHPSHYKQGGIETIDFIEAKQLTYNLGNVVKYITRAGIKNKATHIEDLEKAAWYLSREIQNLKK